MYSVILHFYDIKIPYAGKLNEKNISFKVKKMSSTYSLCNLTYNLTYSLKLLNFRFLILKWGGKKRVHIYDIAMRNKLVMS